MSIKFKINSVPILALSIVCVKSSLKACIMKNLGVGSLHIRGHYLYFHKYALELLMSFRFGIGA